MGAREDSGKRHLCAATKLAWIRGEVSTSLGPALLSGTRTRAVPLLLSRPPCSSL